MKKGIRIIIYVIFALVVLYFGVQWILEGKIKNIVEKKVYEMTQGTVKAEVGSVSLRLISRSLWLKEVRISSDTGAGLQNGLPLIAAEGYLKQVGIRGIHFEKKDSVIYLRAKGFELDVSRLSADMLKKSRDIRFMDRNIPRLQLQIQKITVRLGHIHCREIEGRDSAEFRLQDFNGEVNDWEMNTLFRNTGLPFSCRDLQMSLSSFQYSFGENSQVLEIDSLKLQGEKGRFAVGNIRLMPRYGMYEFAKKVPGHTDWTRIKASGLQGKGFSLRRLMSERFIYVDSISLEKASVSSFKNRQIEQKPRVKRLFYESVQEFSLPFAVRRVALNDVDVEYLELAKHGLSPGKITFSDLQGVFYDLTNRPQSGQSFFTLKAKGKLMDQGKIQAVFRLPADSIKPDFEIAGEMGSLNLVVLNPILEPLAKIKVTSGHLEKMTFEIKGNLQKARVDMAFLYERLRIRIMKEKDGKLETSSFLTTLANGMIVKENNPDHRGMRKGEGWAERDPYRSQFNYLWKILLEGLKKSVGL